MRPAVSPFVVIPSAFLLEMTDERPTSPLSNETLLIRELDAPVRSLLVFAH
jgi:hypothetical protein